MNTIKFFLKKSIFLYSIIVVYIIILGKQSDHYFKWIHPDRLDQFHTPNILSDGSGYYAYLPEWYIYQNDFNFVSSIYKKYNQNLFVNGIGIDSKTNRYKDKYFVGTAICSTPVFLINHVINKIVYGEGDGYSRSYQLTVSINALFFWFLGCVAILLLLRKWRIENFWKIIIIGLLTFGTNLNFYTIYFPSFSHVYSFAAISWFIYIGYCWAEQRELRFFIMMCLLIGLIFSIRPTNLLIILFIPFFFKNFIEFKSSLLNILRKKPMIFLLGIFCFLLFVFLQLYNVYTQIGEWKLNTYSDEHFDFLFNPQLFNVLFSYKKGFFVYAPAMFVIFFGIYGYYKENKYQFLGWIFVSFVFLYLTSAWWCWWYGGGLGMRPFIDILSFLIIPFVIFIQKSQKMFRIMSILLLIPFIYFYQILQIQFNKNIIHYDLMDQTNYWRVFLQTDLRFSWSAAFKDEQIPSNGRKLVQNFYFNENSYEFDNTANALVLNKDRFSPVNPVFIYVPTKKYSIQNIGFTIKGNLMITKENSNPCIHTSYYKKGKILKKSETFMGYRIPSIKTLVPFSIELYPKLQFEDVDSVKIEIGRGEIPTKYTALKIALFRIKNDSQ
ncbi:MAG: hypothetical protein HYR91_00940 [Flavobacteriia bacterium]|nr:hypothetical protein [Flavobacteriia bacterium]